MNKDKIKNFFTNKYFILTILTFVALIVRLLNLDKPSGLWYDEMLTYIFSSKHFPLGILKTLLRFDFHMPLYYMYVHIWMKLFGSADIVLRLSSVIWGVLTVPAFFYLGKTYKSEKLGYLLSIIGCLSPIMIFYSQEFRFYSMLIFFATISLIYFLKLLEAPNKKNYFLFGASNLVILYIYTMGIIFVGTEIFLLILHFYLYKKDYLKPLLTQLLIFFIFCIPYLYLLFLYTKTSGQSLISPFAWSKSNAYTPLFLINDWFSSFTVGQCTQNADIYKHFFKGHSNILNLIAVSTSSICFITGFVSSLLKPSKKTLYLLSIATAFLGTEIILCLFSDFVLVTKYTVIILPIILLLCCNGLLSIKIENLRLILISLILIIFTHSVLSHNTMPAYNIRPGGFKFPAEQLNKFKYKNAYLIYPENSFLLKKYNQELNFIDFDIPGILCIDKSRKEALDVLDTKFVYTTNKHNSIEKFTPYLLNLRPNKKLVSFFNKSVQKVPQGQTLILLEGPYWNKGFSLELMRNFIKYYQKGKISKKDYDSMLFQFIFSKYSMDIKTILKENPSLKEVKSFKLLDINGDTKWDFHIYKKIK